MNGLQRVAVEAVQAPASVVAHVDRADLTQHAQVLRHLRLGEPEQTTSSLTARSPPATASRISRRLGSATALNASAVVGVRAMTTLYTHIGIFQVESGSSGTASQSSRGFTWRIGTGSLEARPLVRVLGHADTGEQHRLQLLAQEAWDLGVEEGHPRGAVAERVRGEVQPPGDEARRKLQLAVPAVRIEVRSAAPIATNAASPASPWSSAIRRSSARKLPSRTGPASSGQR